MSHSSTLFSSTRHCLMSTEIFFLPFHSFLLHLKRLLEAKYTCCDFFLSCISSPHVLLCFVSCCLCVYLLEPLLLLSSPPFVTFLLFLLQNSLFPFHVYSFFCLIAYLSYYLLHSLTDLLDWALLSTEHYFFFILKWLLFYSACMVLSNNNSASTNSTPFSLGWYRALHHHLL